MEKKKMLQGKKMQDPVILIGHGRSGTSILGGLLRDHLGVAFGTESQFIPDYHRMLSRYGSLEQEENLRRLIDDLLKERWFQRSHKFNAFQLDADTIISAVEEKTYAGVLNAIFGLFAKHLQMARWGDKTPAYIHHLDLIHELFPNAKYIYLVRDGRDVAISVIKSYFGPNNIHTAALEWKDTIEKGDRFVESLPPNQVCCLRYEDIVGDPIGSFKSLVAFLGIEDPTGTLSREIEEVIPAKIMQGNYDKWRKSWTTKQRLTFEKLACAQLRAHGYETEMQEPLAEPNVIRSSYWKLLSHIARWRHIAYWKDNFYKVRLRLRRMA